MHIFKPLWTIYIYIMHEILILNILIFEVMIIDEDATKCVGKIIYDQTWTIFSTNYMYLTYPWIKQLGSGKAKYPFKM